MRLFNQAGLALVAFLLLGDAIPARQDPQTFPRTFRGTTDLLMLDVSVLDKSRQPVSGLTAGDFTVMVDGQARPVVAFKAVEMPPPPPPLLPSVATWTREIAPDVATNDQPAGRVIAIVIDDFSLDETRMGPYEIKVARQTAMSIVDQLGPHDRAAVIYTKNSHTAQTFTTDRQLLLAAIENSAIFSAPPPLTGMTPDTDPACLCRVCSIETLDHVAQSLLPLSEQRKIAFYISAGPLVLADVSDYCNMRRREAMHDALRQAHAANVTIHAMDPKGLVSGEGAKAEKGNVPQLMGTDAALAALNDERMHRPQFLRMIAESTGGRAVVNNNDPYQQTPSLFAESSSYYLLGVEPPTPMPDGRFHPVQVRVNRSDVEVRTRNGYYDPTGKESAAKAASLDAGALTPLISGPISTSGIPLTLAAAPFAMADGQPGVTIALSVGQPAGDARPMPHTEIIDMVASLFYPETGGTAGWQQQRLSLAWTKSDPRFASYEILSRVSAPANRYELRVGVRFADGRTSSVYTSVEVPDFEGPLSLSGLIVNAMPSPAVAPPDGLSDLLPIVPTARRTFQNTDRAKAFLRVYQRAQKFSTATVATTLTSTSGEVVVRDDKKIQGAPAAQGSSSDYQIDLPLADLPAGEYLLTISVTVDKRNAQRQLRFTVE